MAGFVFHGGVLPFQGRDGNNADVSLLKGEVTLPSIGGAFSRTDGPWILPAAGTLGSGRIESVSRTVKGEVTSAKSFKTTVTCTMVGLNLPVLQLKAKKLTATLLSTFDASGRTFDETVEVEGLEIDATAYTKDVEILRRVKGQTPGTLRSTTDTLLQTHLAGANAVEGLAADSGNNLACYLVQGTPVITTSRANVVMGEYSIGEDARRLTMLRIDNPASPEDSIVLLQLFVNGHRPP